MARLVLLFTVFIFMPPFRVYPLSCQRTQAAVTIGNAGIRPRENAVEFWWNSREIFNFANGSRASRRKTACQGKAVSSVLQPEVEVAVLLGRT
jgi:hypothetical protein